MSKSLSYIDVNWLQVNGGLSQNNVLSYFYLSPFYNKNCSNEIVRLQFGNNMNMMLQMIGEEYVLDHECIDAPHLFVIKKQYRSSISSSDLKEGILSCMCLL